jgi:hypothetical protein
VTNALLRALGVFYAFGGVLVLIRLDQARLLDSVYAALAGGPRLRHTVRAVLLALGGVLTCVGGVALAALSDRTTPLMAVNTLVQFGWIAYAQRRFAPENADERKSRQQTISAAVAYATAFALLCWMQRSERVLLTNSRLIDVLLAVLLAVMAAWQAWAVWRSRMQGNASLPK